MELTLVFFALLDDKKKKKKPFQFVKYRAWKKLNGWKEKIFSKAGKVILIKTVVQAIPPMLWLVFFYLFI